MLSIVEEQKAFFPIFLTSESIANSTFWTFEL